MIEKLKLKRILQNCELDITEISPSIIYNHNIKEIKEMLPLLEGNIKEIKETPPILEEKNVKVKRK